jgi:hypothetical protein
MLSRHLGNTCPQEDTQFVGASRGVEVARRERQYSAIGCSVIVGLRRVRPRNWMKQGIHFDASGSPDRHSWAAATAERASIGSVFVVRAEKIRATQASIVIRLTRTFAGAATITEAILTTSCRATAPRTTDFALRHS